jgi:sugar-specific transcriptional regulator TrmB
MKSEIKLELLGLNKYEAMAYQALIRLGKSGASEISQNSGVPYGRIYDTLNSLVAKGLIIVIPEKAKKFAPAPPEALEKLLALQQRNLTQLKDEIKKLKQIYVPSAEEPVEIVKGKRNFYKIIQKIPHSKHYNYEFKFTSEVKHEWVRKA